MNWKMILLNIVLLPTLLQAQVTRQFGQSSQSKLSPGYIKMLVWNIHGGSDEGFAQQYLHYSKNQHLVLIQEANLNDELESDLLAQDLSYTHARSFISPISGTNMGVAIGSVAPASSTRSLRSPVSELGFTTPKAVLLQTFQLEKREQSLLVVNVHAINFVTNAMFREHIAQIEKAMAAHKGPVIAAGDFNTWNSERLAILDRAMNRLGITRLTLGEGRSQFPDLGRWFGVQIGGAFDQIYTRGLKIRYKEIHADATASDHKPIEIHFSIL